MEGEEIDVGAVGLPPPPPVPEGAVPSNAPGYGGGDGSALSVGLSHSGPNGGTALAALTLLPNVPVPAKATRPDYGGARRPTQFCVNYFRSKLVKAEDVYHYNVSIEPAVTNKKVSRDIFEKIGERSGEAECGGKYGAHDGEKSFLKSGSLNFNTKEFPVILEDRKGPTFRPGDRGPRRLCDSSPTQSPPPLVLPCVMQWSPGEEVVTKRRRTASRGRDFVVKIEFASKLRMKAIEDMMRGPMGKGDLEQEERALDALSFLTDFVMI